MVTVSHHGARRIRERMGLPKRAARREAERAWRRGVDAAGFCRVPAGGALRLYGHFVFVFGAEARLVTVLYARHRG